MRIAICTVTPQTRSYNSKLDSVKIESLGIEFNVDYVSHAPIVFQVKLRDALASLAPLHVRGSGNQKLIKLMFALLKVDATSDHIVLLLDEPENSLHADAQHSFRRVLETFSEHPNIQVIYATHSPAMINPRRPESLRLLTREFAEDGAATTKIDNKPYIDSGFQRVRSQLGLLPSDSLIFAPITTIVEGPSDSRALNSLFRRLAKESSDDKYGGLSILHRLTMFFPAGGFGEFTKWLEFAQSNGVLPILLYDGDQFAEITGMAKNYPDVPVLHFDDGEEFENIVPSETYFKALAEIVPLNGNLTEDKFKKWEASANLPDQMMFTKRIKRWLRGRV